MSKPIRNGSDQSDYLDRIRKISDNNEITRLLEVIKKSLPIILIIIVLSVVTSILIIRWTSPIYEASSVIQINRTDNARSVVNIDQLQNEDGLFSEIEILQSKLLIQRTFQSFPVNVRYFTEGNFLTHEKYPASVYQIDSANVHRSDIYGQKIYVSFNGDENYNLTIGEQIFSNLQYGKIETIDGLTIQLSTISESLSEDKSGDFYFIFYSPEMLEEEFISKLKVSAYNTRAKSVIISARGRNPRLISDFINAHIQTYLKYGIELENKSAENVLSFLDDQLSIVSKNLDDAEGLLSSFKSKNRFSETGLASNSLFEKLGEYDDESVDLEFQEKLLAQLEDLAKQESEEIDVYHLMGILVGSNYKNALKSMVEELASLLKTREEVSYLITTENERFKTINYQIGIQKRLILESVISLRSSLKNRIELINTKKRSIEGQFSSIPSKEMEFARYQRLFSISEKYYNLLLGKRTDYEISKAGRVTDIEILSTAKPSYSPISPKKSIIYMSIIGLGIILSIVWTLLKYLSYNKISSLNDIVKHSGGSIHSLGIVPKCNITDPNYQLLIHRSPKSILAESFRKIKTNLQFINNEPGPKSLAITSTVSGEGKTFISINLGGILALSLKKVIILDLDLRKPKVHMGFNAQNKNGMSTILTGQDNFEDCIQESELKNLYFISAGIIPPNPYELINNGKLSELLTTLQKTFDYVIIDTPPIGLVSDGFSVLQSVDYPLYIFKADASKLNFIQNLDKLAHENNLNHISSILNNVNLSKSVYGRRINYGYGYIDMDKKSLEYYID